jgi:hypothetical protein
MKIIPRLVVVLTVMVLALSLVAGVASARARCPDGGDRAPSVTSVTR